MHKEIRGDISIVLAGEAGQGIQSIESVLARALKNGGYNLFATKEYMSRIRGGANSTEIRVSSERVSAYTERIDILIALGKEPSSHVKKRITPGTLVITGDPFEKIAKEAGNPIYLSSAASGFVCGLLGIESGIMTDIIEKQFENKSDEIRDKNREASLGGYKMGLEYLLSVLPVKIEKDPERVSKEMVLSGADAVALGALAGGCNYVCAYPMSPSTGVLTAMASYSRDADIIVEQIEDEVGALNMAIGAWYAGAKALVTTAGGGFALMIEAFSLAGMVESPAVILLAQRPGPATGQPTRTEQGDLNMAVYAGHGTFPRVIYAPASLEEAFNLTERAFFISDSFQVPAVILVDQFFVDSYYNTPEFKMPSREAVNYFVKTEASYKRYSLEKDGLSPRGIPGFGDGLVRLDSDEHDQDGFITEDIDLRVKMVNKRMAKTLLLDKENIQPIFSGPENYKNLVIGWGSTDAMIREALAILQSDKTAYLRFPQVFPFPVKSVSYLEKAGNIICVENNEAGQFADLIKQSTGIDIKNRVLKYDGLPFSSEEIARRLGGLLK